MHYSDQMFTKQAAVQQAVLRLLLVLSSAVSHSTVLLYLTQTLLHFIELFNSWYFCLDRIHLIAQYCIVLFGTEIVIPIYNFEHTADFDLDSNQFQGASTLTAGLLR